MIDVLKGNIMLHSACVDGMVSNESLRYSLDLHKAEGSVSLSVSEMW